MALASAGVQAREMRTRDKRALLALYDGANGECWREPWPADAHEPTSDPCSGWAGVYCDTDGYLLGLDLSNQDLLGTSAWH